MFCSTSFPQHVKIDRIYILSFNKGKGGKMLKKTVVFIAILLVIPVAGFTQGSSVGLKISTLGGGLEVDRSFSDSIGGRIGVNNATIDYTATIDDIEYNFDVNLMSISALLDWYPFKGSFRISGGVLYNDNNLDADAKSANTYEVGGTQYTGLEVGNLTGKIDFDDITPYFGIGWNVPLGKSKRFGFLADLGVVYQGTPEVDLSADGLLANNATFQNDLQNEEEELQSKLDGYEYYPVIAIGLSYRF
jgi:hypothetical protein